MVVPSTSVAETTPNYLILSIINMSQLSIKRINNEEVKPVKSVEEDKDKRPVAGASLFSEIYSNIFFCARKKSGKTCAIAHIIDKCATKETRIIAFVATIYRDPTWRAIEQMCEKKGIEFTAYTSIKDTHTREDILQSIVDVLKAEHEARVNGGGEDTEVSEPQDTSITAADCITTNDDPDPKQKKPRKPKFKAPQIIFVFDDLSGELKTPSLIELLKMHRHFKSKVIISSQYWNDIASDGRKQIDYVLLFKGLSQSIPKLKEIYDNCDPPVTFEVFLGIYRFCTAEQFNFMYITRAGEFRKNFNYQINLPKELED